jgi:hypothetical protein
MDTHVDQLWMGNTGEVYIGNPEEEDVSYYAQITKVLPSGFLSTLTHAHAVAFG